MSFVNSLGKLLLAVPAKAQYFPISKALYETMMIKHLVLKILAEESGKQLESINLNDCLLGDLGIDGDDAWEVFERCHKDFGLDISGIEFLRYFRTEPCFKSPSYFVRKFKLKDEHLAAQKQPIKVEQLIEACENGHW